MDIAAIIDSVSRLLWPVLAVIVLWKLYPSVLKIIESRGFKVKVGEMEVTVQEASDQLRAQVEDLQKKVSELRLQVQQQEEPVLTPSTIGEPIRESIRRILWVDDHPENNAYEIATLRSEGFEVRQAISTDEAVRVLMSGRFDADALISDMGREEGGKYQPVAGLRLIELARESDIQVPIFVYTTSRSTSKYREEVVAASGNGITASPVELFEMINTWGEKS